MPLPLPEAPVQKTRDCKLPYRDMTTRVIQTPSAPCRKLATPMIDAVLRSAREMARSPCHLAYFCTTQPAAAPRPSPAVSFGSIASRARMRGLTTGGNPSMGGHVEGSRARFEADELQHIRVQGNYRDEDAAQVRARTRKRQHEAKIVSDLHDTAQKLKRDAATTTVTALWKQSALRKIKDVAMWNDRLQEALAWDRVWELEDVAEKHSVALQHARDAVEKVRATGEDLLARGCELTQEVVDERWDAQEEEARAAHIAEASRKSVEDAREAAIACGCEVKRCARLLKVSEAAYDVADLTATRLRDRAECAATKLRALQEKRALSALVEMRHGEDGDDEKGPKAKRARR